LSFAHLVLDTSHFICGTYIASFSLAFNLQFVIFNAAWILQRFERSKMGLSGVGATELAGLTDGGAIEQVRVRVLPDGRMSVDDAARYLGHAPKTLAMWRLRGIGPRWRKVGGRIFYFQCALDDFVGGDDTYPRK
jgi:hypothetical protein